MLQAYTGATRYGADSHKAWHAWALCNVTALAHIEAGAAQEGATEMHTERQLEHVVHALKGFFRSITLRASRGSEHALQDLLRLLTLWFRYGGEQQVEAALLEGFDAVDIDTWLLVIPQVIARINAPNMRVRKSVHALLLRVGRQHPQALIYPLAVASHEARNQNLAASSRGRWAERILQSMRAHCDALVEQAAVVVAAAPVAARLSRRLCQTLILTMGPRAPLPSRRRSSSQTSSTAWRSCGASYGTNRSSSRTADTSTTSSRRGSPAYDGPRPSGCARIRSAHPRTHSQGVDAMLHALAPLYRLLEQGADTDNEHAFAELYGADLVAARAHCKAFVNGAGEGQLQAAWERFYAVIRQLGKSLQEPSSLHLELALVSPRLLAASDLELAVPGTYQAREIVART